MKKKILILMLILCLFLVGCTKNKNNMDGFIKRTNKMKGYDLKGTLRIINNEDTYLYDIKVSHKDKDLYKVSLKNKANDHEQLIIKNNSGVYVVTPSLNKSFKFQSEWPYNNSQSYLIESVLNDINKDKNKKIENRKNETIVITKANYINNPKLKSQKIYFKDDMLKKVEVNDEDGNIKIEMKFENIDLNPKFKKDYFDIKVDKNIKTEETSKQLEDIVYPMNMPKNTYLASEEKVNTKNGERAILTFLGESPFTIVEETANVNKNFETSSIDGEPELLLDTVGSLSEDGITWISNGVEYYATSTVMNEVELLEVIKSMNTVPVSK